MSAGPSSYQRRKPRAIASSASVVRRSAPVAATSAIATAIDVSSVHSPGAKPPSPPPIIAGASPVGGNGALPNS